MRVLLIHNYYQWPGGEDHVFAAEAELLESHGHEVSRYTAHNDAVAELGLPALAGKTVWNRTAYRELQAVCEKEQPQVAHFHNTFPLLSPAAYYAARSAGAAVVQTLHNYRLVCPGTTLYRDGNVCEDCLGKSVPWPGVAHGCYRDSRSASAGAAALVTVHRLAKTWTRAVDAYIALTQFARRKFIQGGLPGEKIVCKPNFLSADPGIGAHQGKYALFVGRLSEEKGVRQLLRGWDQIGEQLPLKVVGDGPLAPLLHDCAPHVEWLGQQSKERVLSLMRDAFVLIFPSEWYETFGLVMIEAFATGLPVIAGNLGAAAELVDHGRTGLHYRSGDPNDLAANVQWAVNHRSELVQMGRRAREEYLRHYTAESNYQALLDIYRSVSRPSAMREVV